MHLQKKGMNVLIDYWLSILKTKQKPITVKSSSCPLSY